MKYIDHEVQTPELSCITAFSVNFHIRKLCIELHLTNLHTALGALMFVINVSFPTHFALSPQVAPEIWGGGGVIVLMKLPTGIVLFVGELQNFTGCCHLPMKQKETRVSPFWYSSWVRVSSIRTVSCPEGKKHGRSCNVTI